MKQKGDSKYKRLIEVFMLVAKRVLPTYSNKFSKHTYTQYQHAASICLMKYENKPYRDVVDLMDEIADYFGFIKSVPHFTTLQKFLKRLPQFVWDFILTKTFRLITTERVVDVGVDATGYKERHASSYYTWRVVGDNPYKRLPYRRFMKNSLAVDINNQAIIAAKVHRSRHPDIADFRPLVSRTAKTVKVANVVADKGYDSEENHRFVREKIGAFSVIPPRVWGPNYKTHGKYRKQMRRNFPSKLYHKRNMNETVNSVQKRKFGDELRSRIWYMRKREMKVINVVYNVHRYLKITFDVVVRGFLLRGLKPKYLNGTGEVAS